jgi:hypothetical protein
MLRLIALASIGLLAIFPASAELYLTGPHLNYVLHCQGCHLADGSETPGGVPALAGSVGRFLAVPGGRKYLARVPGARNAPVGDVELAALLNWMIDRFGGSETPEGWVRYTPEEVTQLRGLPMGDIAETRAGLVRASGAPH